MPRLARPASWMARTTIDGLLVKDQRRNLHALDLDHRSGTDMCPRPAALPDPGKPGLPKGERISAAADRASGHTAGDETKRMQRFKA